MLKDYIEELKELMKTLTKCSCLPTAENNYHVSYAGGKDNAITNLFESLSDALNDLDKFEDLIRETFSLCNKYNESKSESGFIDGYNSIANMVRPLIEKILSFIEKTRVLNVHIDDDRGWPLEFEYNGVNKDLDLVKTIELGYLHRRFILSYDFRYFEYDIKANTDGAIYWHHYPSIVKATEVKRIAKQITVYEYESIGEKS
jgi:hypothetical protein